MLSHRKGVLLDGIGSELVRASTGGSRKTLSKWLGDLSNAINLGDVASTFTSGDATPSVLNNSKFITAGTTAITNFDDGVEGQTITIYRGASDIVITDNANIDPIIAGDITLSTARPSATFRLASSVWKQVEEAGAIATTFLPVAQALTLAASLTAAGLGTGDSPQFAGVNIGHASDTTITRVSAGKIAVEGDTIASWAAANTFSHTTGNTFNGRINIDPTFAVYDQYATVEAPLINFGAAALTVAASKQLDFLRADNAITVGSAGVAAFSTINFTSASGSHSTSNTYGLLHSITNAGPGTVKTLYGRAIGSGSSTGAIVGVVAAVTPGASTSLAAALQVSVNSTTKKADYGIWLSPTNATDTVDYAILIADGMIVNQAGLAMFADGAGSLAKLFNASGAATLIDLTSTGEGKFAAGVFPVTTDGAAVGSTSLMWSDVFLASGAIINFNDGNYTLTHSAGALTASNSFIAPNLYANSTTNGMTLSQAALTRNHAAGSFSLVAGTNAGNSIQLQTGGSTRLSVADSTVAVTGLLTVTSGLTTASGTAIPAGGSSNVSLKSTSTTDFGVFFGSGAPSLSAAKGSIYLRSDGSGVNDRMYVNTNGSTTWTAVVTVA